ncbi:MAG: FliM/FliN family flagellar motor switch protein [Pseudomonadota bacterium]
MRLLTRGGRPPKAYGEITPAKSMRLAAAKAGQDVLSQPVMGSGVEELQAVTQKLAELLPEGGMTMFMRGPEATTGLIALDRNAVAAVTEALTKGKINEKPAPDRKLTTTDGFVCRGFLESFLKMFVQRLAGQLSAPWAQIYEIDEMIQDLRRLPLMLHDVAYRVLTMDCDFGNGAKIGQICMVFPWDTGEVVDNPDEPAKEELSEEELQQRAENALLPVELELEVILAQLEMTVGQLDALQPGDLIPVARSDLQVVRLIHECGTVVAVGELGESMGEQCVRLLAAPGEDVERFATAPDEPAPPPPPVDHSLELINLAAKASTHASMSGIEMPTNIPTYDPSLPDGGLDLPDLEAPYPDGEIPGLAIPGEDDTVPLDLDLSDDATTSESDQSEGASPMDLDLNDISMTSFEDLPETID